MALRVSEIMNGELFSVGEDDTVDMALRAILVLGITGAPVVDEDGKPVGHVSLRDLVGPKAGNTVGDRMTAPAATVPAEAWIAEAARTLARTRYHRLIVVDCDGRAIGMVSAVDIVRGLLGVPAPHPASFPHLDRLTGLSWTDEMPLDLEHVLAAPAGPGVLVLYHGGTGMPEGAVWAEAPDDLRRRLTEMLSVAQPGRLRRVLEYDGVRFRAASVPDPPERAEALAAASRQLATETRPSPAARNLPVDVLP